MAQAHLFGEQQWRFVHHLANGDIGTWLWS
ncbi:MAG: hypothetical protein GPOALKHO_001704 [Sodalis sp.]|nr:MAG: hypothetical protein GPOALKHO_001704 [Sodalis sp.]